MDEIKTFEIADILQERDVYAVRASYPDKHGTNTHAIFYTGEEVFNTGVYVHGFNEDVAVKLGGQYDEKGALEFKVKATCDVQALLVSGAIVGGLR